MEAAVSAAAAMLQRLAKAAALTGLTRVRPASQL